ncbi:Uncharacterised protein [Escherichia coli]|uniref:Uncharacterized protein n=1 Tax=Escherichia coli TaxID=562 RepID=A0A376Y973_ECOLX|nr:Uncharacterised protein [Escherichia coli]
MDLRRFITLKTVVEEGFLFASFAKIVLYTIDGDFSYSAALSRSFQSSYLRKLADGCALPAKEKVAGRTFMNLPGDGYAS